MWAGAAADRLINEFRIAFRTLRRTPRFSIAAIACMAIGVVIERKRRLAPLGVCWPPVNDTGRELVMSVAKDVGADPDRIANDTLGWISTPVYLGADTLDCYVLEAAREVAAVGFSGH